MSFRSVVDQEAAVQILELVGLAGGTITRYPSGEMPACAFAQDAARSATCWLLVRVPDEYLADWVIETVRATGAERVHTCQRVVVDALIDVPDVTALADLV